MAALNLHPMVVVETSQALLYPPFIPFRLDSSVTNPNMSENDIRRILEEEFASLRESVDYVYKITHPLLYPGPRMMWRWEDIISSYVDPVGACFRSTVKSLARSIVDGFKSFRNKTILSLQKKNNVHITDAVLSYMGDVPWKQKYLGTIESHLWKIEAYLWRNFANWRLEQDTPPRSTADSG